MDGLYIGDRVALLDDAFTDNGDLVVRGETGWIVAFRGFQTAVVVFSEDRYGEVPLADLRKVG